MKMALTFTPVSLYATAKGYLKISMYDEAIGLLERTARKGYLQANYILALVNFYIFLNSSSSSSNCNVHHLKSAVARARDYTEHFPECGEGFYLLGHLAMFLAIVENERHWQEQLIDEARETLQKAAEMLPEKREHVNFALHDLEHITAASYSNQIVFPRGKDDFAYSPSLESFIEDCHCCLLN